MITSNSTKVLKTIFEPVDLEDADLVLERAQRDKRLVLKPRLVDKASMKAYGFNVNLRQKNVYDLPQRTADLELLQAEGMQIHVDEDAEAEFERWTKRSDIAAMLLEAHTYEGKPNHPSWQTFMDHQRVGTIFLASRSRAILGLSPGLGKSATAIVAADILKDKIKRVLVVTPLTLLGTWKYEINKWSERKDVFVARGAFSKADNNATWTVTNPESVFELSKDGQRRIRSCYANDEWDLILLDESLLYKNRKALRAKMLKQLGLNTAYMWMLSGNPMTKFADDLWAQLNMLSPKDFSSYWRFAKQWCILEETPWGMKVVANKNPKRLRWYLRDVLLTRTFEDVPNAPELALETVHVDLDSDQEELIKEINTTASYVTTDGQKVDITAAIAVLKRVSQTVSNPASLKASGTSAKTSTALQLLETSKLPAIVWFEYVESLKSFSALASRTYRVGHIYGEVPNKQRQANIDDFQSGKLDILCCQLSAGKYGLSLTKAHTVIFHDRSFSTDDWVQSTHRVRRLSSEHVATGYILHGGYTDDLVDEILAGNIRSLSQLSMTDIEKYTRGK